MLDSTGLSGDSQSPIKSLPPAQEAVSLSNNDDIESHKTWYPESWMSLCRMDSTKIGGIVLSPTMLSFWGPDGTKYQKFPAWHKKTGSLVYMIPEDIPGGQQIIAATDLKVQAVLLQSPSAAYNEMNLG